MYLTHKLNCYRQSLATELRLYLTPNYGLLVCIQYLPCKYILLCSCITHFTYLKQSLLLLVACFVTATYALALSCALLCLSITLLLLSHVPCFVSASLTSFLLSLVCLSCLNCYRSCSFMCIALSQHHAALTLSQGITLLLFSHQGRFYHGAFGVQAPPKI